ILAAKDSPIQGLASRSTGPSNPTKVRYSVPIQRVATMLDRKEAQNEPYGSNGRWRRWRWWVVLANGLRPTGMSRGTQPHSSRQGGFCWVNKSGKDAPRVQPQKREMGGAWAPRSRALMG